MRALVLVAGLAVSAPAFAADGTYFGKAEYVDGNANSCRGMEYKLVVVGSQVTGKLTPYAGSAAAIRDVSGTLAPDGTLNMTYVAGYGSSSGQVSIQLKLDGDTFTGVSQSQTCKYKVTAKRG